MSLARCTNSDKHLITRWRRNISCTCLRYASFVYWLSIIHNLQPLIWLCMMPLSKTAQWVCCSGAISPPLRQLLSPNIPFFVFLSSKAFKRGSKFTTSMIGAIDSAYQTQTKLSSPSIIHYIYWLVWIIFLSIKIVEIHVFFMVLSSLSFHFSVIYLSIHHLHQQQRQWIMSFHLWLI